MRRRAGERGSALLIVFVMAAAVAILLYTELPVAAFEAQRQNEQRLIDRGNEYAHAVKLFVRKTGTYPQTLDALEDTNRMRFLRHRFTDPFTGKDDWRLLHAGPGGMLIDSKVNPFNANSNGQNGSGIGGGNATGFGASSSASFSASNNPVQTPSNSDTAEVVVPTIRQRPPAIAANGGRTSAAPDATTDTNADAAVPPLPLAAPETASAGASQTQAGQAGVPSSGAPTPGIPGVNGPAVGQGGITASAATATVDTGGAVTPGTSALNAAGLRPSNPGGLSSGGIAGVASKATGHTIKTINDQSDYSRWEFYFDPSKDMVRLGMAGQTGYQSLPPGSSGQTGTTGAFGNSNSTASPQTNGTGQTNGFGLGNSNSSMNAPNSTGVSTFSSSPATSSQNPSGPQQQQ